MVIEAALTNGDRSRVDVLPNRSQIARRLKGRGIVRVHSGGPPHDARVRTGNGAGAGRGGECFTNADDALHSRRASASQDGIALVIEGHVGEVCVTIDHATRGCTPAAFRRRVSGPLACADWLGVTPLGLTCLLEPRR